MLIAAWEQFPGLDLRETPDRETPGTRHVVDVDLGMSGVLRGRPVPRRRSVGFGADMDLARRVHAVTNHAYGTLLVVVTALGLWLWRESLSSASGWEPFKEWEWPNPLPAVTYDHGGIASYAAADNIEQILVAAPGNGYPLIKITAAGAPEDGWTSAAVATVGTGGSGVVGAHDVLVAQPSGRIVAAAPDGVNFRINFSNPLDPTTLSANTVGLAAGGGPVERLVRDGERFLAFKDEDVYVFTGESVGVGSVAIFHRTLLAANVGWFRGACEGDSGVFFATERGVYQYSGGQLRELTRNLRPLFPAYGGVDAAGQQLLGRVADERPRTPMRLAFVNGVLYVAYRAYWPRTLEGDVAPRSLLLAWHAESDQWSIHDLNTLDVAAVNDGTRPRLVALGDETMLHELLTLAPGDDRAGWSYETPILRLGGDEVAPRHARIYGRGTVTVSWVREGVVLENLERRLTLGEDRVQPAFYDVSPGPTRELALRIDAKPGAIVTRIEVHGDEQPHNRGGDRA